MFNPLGNFDQRAPINTSVLEKAHGLYSSLPSAPPSSLTRVYYHWTVSALGACFDDYNVEALVEKEHWALKITHDPRDNSALGDLSNYAKHTFHRNKGAVGVAITGMDGADVHNFSRDAVTVIGLHHLCAAGAAVCKRYGIDTTGMSHGGPYTGEPNIMTHAEAAMLAGYPPQYDAYGIATTGERWDLASLTALPADVALTPQMAKTCGDALRFLTRAYKVAMA